MILLKNTGLLIILVIFIGCQETGTSSQTERATVISEPDTTVTDPDSSKNEKILIIDNTGKKWDVTHAVNVYNFIAENFQYGLGPNAIRPILNPQMISQKDRGYPGSGDDMIVIGVSLNGFTRAYPIRYLFSHEVVDDKFDRTYVAVSY